MPPNHRMNPTGPIGPRVSAASRAFSVPCRRGSFTHPARRVMRVPMGRRLMLIHADFFCFIFENLRPISYR